MHPGSIYVWAVFASERIRVVFMSGWQFVSGRISQYVSRWWLCPGGVCLQTFPDGSLSPDMLGRSGRFQVVFDSGLCLSPDMSGRCLSLGGILV